MRFDFANHHVQEMSRREALKFGAGAAASAAAVSALLDAAAADAAATDEHGPDGGEGQGGTGRHDDTRHGGTRFDDTMFDIEAVVANGWGVSRYGPDDQRGTLNEVTPRRTAAAMARLGRGEVNAYQLGESMFNGFPAFPSDPPRRHDMFLYVLGYEAPESFTAGGGIQASPEPFGPNQLTGHEERFAENFTFQIATQVDGLNHVGTGQWYYNDNKALDFITPTGTSKLGNETMGPIATRGIVLDIVGLKVATGRTDEFFLAPNGRPVLVDDYRITIDDIENSLHRQRLRPIGAGDVPILHTGWTHLVRDDPERYLAQEPGIFLAEARYLADKRVAIAASDNWGLEVLDPAVTGGNAFPCHQELFGKHGVRIGESFVTDSAIDDHCYEGLLVITPENVPGATCGSSAPTLLGVKGRPPRR